MHPRVWAYCSFTTAPMPRKVNTGFAAEALVRNRAAALAGISMATGELPALDQSDTLRSRREALGISPEALCAALAIASSSLRNYESGRSLLRMPPHQLQDLMQILRVSFEELLVLCANTASKDDEATLRGIGRDSPYPARAALAEAKQPAFNATTNQPKPMKTLNLPPRLFIASSMRDPSVSAEERFAACSLLFTLNPHDVGLRHFFDTEPVPADWETVAAYRAGFERELAATNAGYSNGADA